MLCPQPPSRWTSTSNEAQWALGRSLLPCGCNFPTRTPHTHVLSNYLLAGSAKRRITRPRALRAPYNNKLTLQALGSCYLFTGQSQFLRARQKGPPILVSSSQRRDCSCATSARTWSLKRARTEWCDWDYASDAEVGSLSFALCRSAGNAQNASHGPFLFVYLNGEFFKNHFFHFTAPLDRGIKIAKSTGAKLLRGVGVGG